MKKYNFDLILTDEQLKANRQRHLQQDKNNKIMIVLFVIAFTLLTLLTISIFTEDNAAKERVKNTCDIESKELFQYHRYDGEKVWGCR